MDSGKTVRFRRSSLVARHWNIPDGAQGTVICSYRLVTNHATAPHRVDVCFGPRTIVWGAPAAEFEEIGPSSESLVSPR
jgi:hypothetical protein